MYFESLSAFWHMGGYGFYVWLSFGVGLASLTITWLASLLTKKQLLNNVLVEKKRLERIKQAQKQQAEKAALEGSV